MCEVIRALNKKPKTTRPCEMQTLKPGESLLIGKQTELQVEQHINEATGARIYFFKTSGKNPHVSDIFDIEKILWFNGTGLKITPISILLNGKNAGTVHLFVEATKTLQEVLTPAS